MSKSSCFDIAAFLCKYADNGFDIRLATYIQAPFSHVSHSTNVRLPSCKKKLYLCGRNTRFTYSYCFSPRHLPTLTIVVSFLRSLKPPQLQSVPPLFCLADKNQDERDNSAANNALVLPPQCEALPSHCLVKCLCMCERIPRARSWATYSR